MLGLLACSVWVWAIAIDKIFLVFAHQARHGPFRAGLLVGHSIEELYRALSAKPTHRWPPASSPQCANEALVRKPVAILRRATDADREVMNVSIAREVERLERRLLVLATVGRPAPLSAYSAPSGASCRASSRLPPRKTPLWRWWRRALRRRCLPPQFGLIAAIPATIFYNRVHFRGEPAGPAPGRLRRRVFSDPVAPDRRAGVMGGI